MISIFTKTQNFNFFNELINNNKIIKKKIILIVPEQNSFHHEKKAIKISKILKKEIEVLSFSRLTHKIFHKFGGIIKKTAEKANKLTIINLTIFQLKNKLSVYKFLIDKPNFAELILKTIEQIKQNKINHAQIEKKLKVIRDNHLKIKTNEFWLIFKIYNLKLKSLFSDTSDNLEHANKIISNIDSFKNTHFLFSDFFSFNNLQLQLIETIAKQTDLGFDLYYNDKNYKIFSETSKTIENIKKIAIKNKIRILKIKIKTKTKKTMIMTAIENILINPNFKLNKKNQINFKKNKNFDTFTAESIFEEIEWIIIKIFTLLKENHNFSDITIFTTDLKLYKTALICSMKKFKIPFFIDDSITFESMNLIKCCKNLIEAANNEKNIIPCCINILKSDLTKFSITEVSIFENYVYTWEIENLKFNEFFNNKKEKLLKQNDQILSYEQNLKIIKKIQTSLNKATTIIKNSQNNSENIATNIIKSLKILGIESNNLKFINKKTNTDFKLEWNSLISLLESICDSTKNSKIELNQFEFLFKSTSKHLNVKQIPPTLNCITIGSLEKTIPNEPKTIFILGANELNFPKKHFFNNQLFSNTDLINLKKLNINFGKTIDQQNRLSIITAYRAVCSATKNLFLSFTINQDQTNSNEPCQIMKKLQKFFKNSKDTQTDNSNFLEKCITKQLALQQLAKNYDEKSEKIEALKSYFKISRKIFKFNNKNKYSNFKAKNKQKNHQIKNLSPTQIEQFFLCPFSYFCQYVLKIKPIPKIKINNQTLGIVFHYILEKIVSNKNFENFSPSRLKIEIEKETQNFVNNNIKFSLKSKIKFMQTFQNYENILIKLFNSIKQELKISNFKPTFFEYKISTKSEIKCLKIKLTNKNYIRINGKIDRIDIKIQNNEKLIRIIDYKTSDKNLSFSDLLHGLNLQMLLYAMAIYKTNEKQLKLIINAIQYVKILGDSINYSVIERNYTKENLEKIKDKNLFNNGLVFLNDKIDHNVLLKALPFNLTKNNKITKTEMENKILTKNEFNLIFNFIEKKIKKMCFLIENFNFKHTQHIKTQNNSLLKTNCYFCPYKEICNPNLIETIIHKSNFKKNNFLESIKKELKIDQ